MKSKLLSNTDGRREWAVIFDPSDEAMKGLEQFAQAEHLTAAHFTGIGAFEKVTVAWFDLQERKYRSIPINEQVEILSLIGDVAELKSGPSVHADISVAKRDGTVHGGHLQNGLVRPTLELIVVESPAHLRKSFRPEYGIALIDLDRSDASASMQSFSHENKE